MRRIKELESRLHELEEKYKYLTEKTEKRIDFIREQIGIVPENAFFPFRTDDIYVPEPDISVAEKIDAICKHLGIQVYKKVKEESVKVKLLKRSKK